MTVDQNLDVLEPEQKEEKVRKAKPPALKKSDFETFETNPFMSTVAVRTKRRSLTVSRGTKLTDVDTGREELTTTIAHIKSVDEESFVKVFSSQIKLYFDLPAPGFKVFMLLLKEVQEKIGIDRVSLTYVRAQKLAKSMGNTLSRSVFDRGILDLCDRKIIALTDELGFYFINPAVLFNGDRARFVMEFRKKKVGDDSQMQLEGLDGGTSALPSPTSSNAPKHAIDEIIEWGKENRENF